MDDEKEWAKTKDTITEKLGVETADCVMDLVSNFHVSVSVPPMAVKSVCPSDRSTVDLTAHCSSQVVPSPPRKKQKSSHEKN